MSTVDSDRAAKAARAKALLKKRQQQKAANTTSPTTPGAATPSRTLTPGPSEVVVEDVRVLGDLFSNAKDGSDTSWLTSLPRANSPPPPQTNGSATSQSLPVSSPAVPTAQETQPFSKVAALEEKIENLSKDNESLTSEVFRLREYESAAQQAETALKSELQRVQDFQATQEKLQKESEITLENERRTVSLLVGEKAHLAAELKKLDDAESKAQTLEDLLDAERVKAQDFAEQASRLESEVEALSQRAEQRTAREKQLGDQRKDLERQLQRVSASAAESGKEAEDFKRRLRELEEQIQADDRVERLEVSLRHTQDKADELEFQLTKVKQTNTALRTERDDFESKLQGTSTKEREWTTKVSALETSLGDTRKLLAEAESQSRQLSEDKAQLQRQTQSFDSTTKELQDKLAQATSSTANTTRQIQQTQNELKNALRRAEEAESIQKTLQAEGTTLMQSLDKMRPKFVELTGDKLDLSEKVDNLERVLQSRDATIAQLENDLDETRDHLAQSEKVWKEKLAQQEKRNNDSQNGAADVQKAYNELQEELDTALASLRNLELQRANQHQDAARRLEEIERLTNQLRAQSEEFENLRRELESRRKSHHEEQDFLERAHNEIEALRGELSARDDEINSLREAVHTPTTDKPRSLDDEMLSSLRQQHALELSSATSQIRALENTVFDKDSAIHSLQKQINSLEGQASRPKSPARIPSRPFSPTSRTNGQKELRRSSFGHNRPNLPSPLARTVFDQAMTPETMHKRKVSLSMLKARMDSESKVVVSQGPSRAMSPVLSEGTNSRPSSALAHRHSHSHRSQFLDESHVFWCHSCSGDLVIL